MVNHGYPWLTMEARTHTGMTCKLMNFNHHTKKNRLCTPLKQKQKLCSRAKGPRDENVIATHQPSNAYIDAIAGAVLLNKQHYLDRRWLHHLYTYESFVSTRVDLLQEIDLWL